MALIGKIRKNMWLVFIVIGLALAGFVVMDMVTASQQGGMAGATTIGEVDGEPLDYREFSAVESALYGGTGDVYGSRKATWDYMVDKSLISQEAEANGFNVPTEELKSLLFGASPAPIVRQMYTNPNTGQFDRDGLLQLKQAIESGQLLNPNLENRWAQVEKQVRASQLQQKIGTAVAKGMYTPTWMVEQRENVNNTNVDFAVVKIPFDVVEEELSVTEDDVKAFIIGKESRYEQEKETRLLEYVVMNVIPTQEDSMMRKEEVADLVPEFRNTTTDSIFAFNNNGFYAPYYNKTDDLPESVRDVVPSMEVGEVYGPYLDNSSYFAVKLLDKTNVPDSVEARHILRSTEGTSVEDAMAYVDSLRNLLERRVVDFDSLAINNSQDPGSSFNGGDLGTFAQGRMVGPFNDAVFMGSRVGGLYTVKTQFGVHLIEVKDIIYNDREDDYKVAFIRTAVTPSDNTQERLEGEMSELVTQYRTLDELTTAASSKPGLEIESAGPFGENDFNIPGLGSEQSSRDIIKWLFSEDTSEGDVSPELYIYSDKVNYFDSKYVIAGLKEINEPGMPSIVALQSRLETEILKNKRGEAIKSKISNQDLDAIAAQFDTEVDTVSNITFTSTTMPGMGNESSVIAKAYGMAEGSVSNPIIGNNGVYVVKVISKEPAASTSNIPFVRNMMNNSARSQAVSKIMEALRGKAELNDSRSRFF